MIGLDISSDSFWEMRPDIFTIMSDAYSEREDYKWAKVRKLGYLSILGKEGSDKVKEVDLFSIPRIDKIGKVKSVRIELSEAHKQYYLKIANGN